MNEHLKETSENSEGDEEVARRVVLYTAVEAELSKHKRMLYQAIEKGNIEDTNWIIMQKEIIRILEAELNTLND